MEGTEKMKWKPFKGGVPYTCQDCPAMIDMRDDRDRWRKLAEYLCDHAPSVVVPDQLAQLFPEQVVKGERYD
jgi:hypothetical protein